MDDTLDDPLRLPAPLATPTRPPIPLAAAIVPVIGAVVLWWLTRSTYALWFAALGPLMAAAAFADGLRTSRRARRRSAKERAAAFAELATEVERRHDDERRVAGRRTPDVAGYAGDLDEVWRAVPGRADVIVVGQGEGPSTLRIDGDPHDDEARDVRRRARSLSGIPVTVPRTAGIAVSGPPALSVAVVRALALQVCLAHAPGAVRVVGGDGVLADLPHRDATRGEVLFVGRGDQPVPDDVDTPLILLAEGAPAPPRCAAVLTLLGAGRARLEHGGRSQEVVVEGVSAAQGVALAQALRERAERLGHRLDGAVSFADLPALGGGRESLAVAVGASAGESIVLDLVADGPHAVVIGVTGSGKSELLTTWIAGLCRTRTPQEVSLLLVDFKGGRTFDALAALPHVTGVLTDLDEEQAVRAVESLRAEIRHRERVLGEASARDILEAGGALSRLVIVVDEYAALVAAQPELHELFADIAARGRALGMHLILASQRAGGAFRDGVLANAPLRIAFRVTDAADSRTILGQDDAVRLPGTEAARGTALVRRAADSAPRVARVARCDEAALAEIRASAVGSPPARRPWLPPLPDRVDVSDGRLRPAAGPAASGRIVLGLADEPERQRQVAIDLPAGSGGIAVVGGPGSGRTTLLRAIAAQASAPVWVPADAEAAWDVVAALDGVPRGSVVLVDDADALVARLPADHAAAWIASLERACREARSRGIDIVASVTRPTGPVGRVLDLLPHRALLPMTSRGDHVAAGGESADYLPGARPGRGRWGRRLVQFAVAAGPGVGVGSGLGAGFAGDADPAPPLVLGGAIAFVLGPGPRADAVVAACTREGRQVRAVDDPTGGAALDGAVGAGEVIGGRGPVGPSGRAGTAAIAGVGAAAQEGGSAREQTESRDGSPVAQEPVVIGSPEAWLAQWRALAGARERATLVVDADCAAEYRAITGRRDLPPYARPGAGRAWALTPGAPPRRVTLPGAT